jgi:hypothetical protein
MAHFADASTSILFGNCESEVITSRLNAYTLKDSNCFSWAWGGFVYYLEVSSTKHYLCTFDYSYLGSLSSQLSNRLSRTHPGVKAYGLADWVGCSLPTSKVCTVRLVYFSKRQPCSGILYSRPPSYSLVTVGRAVMLTKIGDSSSLVKSVLYCGTEVVPG